MSPALSPPAPQKPWWSRSKPSKEQLRPNRSFSSLAEDSEKYQPSPGSSSRHKDGIPSLKFNTLASAMGFRSKKVPALTIQDPPSPVGPSSPHYSSHSRPGTGNSTPSTSDHNPFYTNRPPAKSVSTVRSSEYDFDAVSDPHTTSEPRTPSDHPRDRMSYQTSVMTFSEIDPFASGGIVVQQLPQDPNRLSVYSDSSMLDPHHQKRGDVVSHSRRSYGSSSSNSHGNSFDGQALSPLSASSFGRSPPASRSAYDLTQPNDAYYPSGPSTSGSQTQRTRRMKTPSGSNSSNSTVTPEAFRSRLSEPGNGAHTLPRKRSSPTLSRPRGMTVGAVGTREGRPDVPRLTTHSPGVVLSPIQPLQVRRKVSGSSSSPSSSNPPSPSPVTFTRSRTTSAAPSIESPVSPSATRPLVLVRKASAPRVKVPPLNAAPPMSDLPPPPPPPIPHSPYHDHDLSPIAFRSSSSSSLSLSFAPSVDGFHVVEHSDAITQLMTDTDDLGPFEMAEPDRKGKRKSNRNTFVLDGDLSPSGPGDGSLPSPLSKFPPVPAFIHGGDLSGSKAGKLLRKMSSQQNLPTQQRHSATSIVSSASHDDASNQAHAHGPTHSHSQSPPPGPSGKGTRKQRSFHAARVPLPPLPGLRHGTSSSSGQPSASVETLPASGAPSSPVVEPRRSSVTSPRKRLFSGSSARRSTSSHGPTSPSTTEDDRRSVFSLETDSRPGTGSAGMDHITLNFGTAGQPLSLMTRNACISPASLWEDAGAGASAGAGAGAGSAGSGPGSKRTSQSEYVPQYIMSPAEQLKLAEKLADEEASVRERPEPEPEPERKPKLDLQPGDFALAFRSRKNSASGQNHREREREAAGNAHRSRSDSVMSHASTGTLAFGRASGVGNGDEPSGLSRGASILSAKSTGSGWQALAARPVHSAMSPPPPPRKMSVGEGARGPSRSASVLSRSMNKPPPISARPSTAQASLTPPTSPTATFSPPSHSPELAPASLPPPPRRRPSRHDLQEVDMASKRVSVVPINPLSPPPVRPRPRRQQSSDTGAPEVASRPPSAFDRVKALQRRSLMKKPSFLDIEDELDADGSAENDEGEEGEAEIAEAASSALDTAPSSPVSPSMESSFLDMGRKDSFDTVRSSESAYYVY
ncbi:hypothetical protein C8Q77DRAFT_1046515 [Trametes polyzona]|nr:hypothetical protein C8Q77DRAFT_1046515 [Trametes polyzona]